MDNTGTNDENNGQTVENNETIKEEVTKKSPKNQKQNKINDRNKKIKKDDKQRKIRKLIEAESRRITKVIVPISICMLIVIISINFFPIFSNGIEEIAHDLGFTFYEKRDASTGSRIGAAIILSVFFLVLLAFVTFCMAIVIIYEFERLIKCFFIFSFLIYFGLLGTAYLSVALREYNIPIDWITVLILMWNYTGLGLVTFFVNGPKMLRQAYLIILSSNVALVLILIIPDWSAWLLVIVMAIWDCYAVLHETGPLNRIFNSDQGRKLPPILYATAVWLQTSSSEDNTELEIGLGDFVFYSILVGKSFSSGDFLTAIICFISILVGLAITLFILLLKNMPLPALPISIALGVIANFTTKFLVIPFNDILTEKQIFI